jgi:uncharacterized protein
MVVNTQEPPGDSGSESLQQDSGSQAPPPLPQAPPELSDFLPLDRRVVNLWRLNYAIGSAIILAVLAIPLLFLAANNPGILKLGVAAWILVAIYRIVLTMWYPPRAYRAWGFRVDGKVLETRSGVWFKVIQLLPLSRLQHVDLHRGPIERSFGLASLALHTAGTVQSTIVIPGLDAAVAAKLRDQLVAIGGDDGV